MKSPSNPSSRPRPAPAPLALAAATVAALLLAACPNGNGPPGNGDTPQLRLKFQDFVADPQRLASLARGVEVMKSRDGADPSTAEYRTSWQYWSAMHSYYGSASSQGGQIANAIASTPASLQHFYNGISDMTPPAQPPGLGSEVWDACEHGTEHFLTWHRWYLFYFERVLRAAAQDNTLRLPYWDYTDPAQVTLPAALGQPQLDGNPNPLFDVRRTSQSASLNPAATNIDNLLTQTWANFQLPLEIQPHGTVHCALGNSCLTPLMGKVPAAATDIVFWLHHANLDRIWECWLRLGGQLPGGAFMTPSFAFVDENGARVERTVSELFGAASPIDYQYDNVDNCARQPARLGRMAMPPEAATQMTDVSPPATDFKIDAPSKSVSFALPTEGPAGRAFDDARTGVDLSRSHLVLEEVRADSPPGALFDIYLSVAGAEGEEPRREYVATLSFFGVGDHPGEHHRGYSITYDVTDQVITLVGSSDEVDSIEVVFEASTGTLEEGQRASAAANFRADSGLRIKSVSLRAGSLPSPEEGGEQDEGGADG